MERRDFIKTTVGAGIALTGTGLLGSGLLGSGCISGSNTKYNAKGLPTVLFGSTGIHIPRIVLGLGSRFCHIDSDDEAIEMLNYALDNGLFYFDTAHTYDNTIAIPSWKKTKAPKLVISEERVGEVVKSRRNEIFLSTKVAAREPAEAMRQIELSLKRLNTDRLEMLKIHGVDRMDEIDQISQKGGVIDIVMRLKEEKVTRFIGFSSHVAEAAKEMVNRAPFDNVLIAMNQYNPRDNMRMETTVSAAKVKKMGVLLMKAVRPRETVAGMQAAELVKYALSLDGPEAVAVGMDSIAVVKSNVDILRNFQKLSPQIMTEMALQLAPFYRHENLPWMQPGYTDGNWKC